MNNLLMARWVFAVKIVPCYGVHVVLSPDASLIFLSCAVLGVTVKIGPMIEGCECQDAKNQNYCIYQFVFHFLLSPLGISQFDFE